MPSISADRPILRAGAVSVEVSPVDGGRIAGLVVDGWDVLVRERSREIGWGSYAMVPWAGRLQEAVLRWRGGEWSFPATMPPHAIHGLLLWQPWRVIGGADGGRELVLGADLGESWPFGGRVVHRLALADDRLEMVLEVHATRDPMPVIVGWHPWFRRRLRGPDGRESAEVEAGFAAASMLEVDPPGIPTGRLLPPAAGPWDDTFVGLGADPVVRWPGALEVTVASPDATHWVVYTEEPAGVCIEPQTGPPNGLNREVGGGPRVLEAGETLTASATLSWR
jgi:galactose mutarotase-like enzyme